MHDNRHTCNMHVYLHTSSRSRKKEKKNHTVTSTHLAAILVTYWSRAWKSRAIGDESSFKTSVVASRIRSVQSFPGTPA